MDFLAREQQVLGATEAAALFGEDTPAFQNTEIIDNTQNIFPEITMTENTNFTSKIPQPEETQAILNFKENFKAVIQERDDKSKMKHDSILKNAKNSIEKFYSEYNEKKIKSIQRNADSVDKPMSDSLGVWVRLNLD